MCGTQTYDLISRKMAIDVLCDNCDNPQAVCAHYPCKQYIAIEKLPPLRPTLYGYNIEHLELIARLLQKEDLPPERVSEALTDIDRIVAVVKAEINEPLRKAGLIY